MTVDDVQQVAEKLLPDLAALCWGKRQAILQEKDAAGEEKVRWQMVIAVIEQRIRMHERWVTQRLDVLKFKLKGEAF